MILYVLATDNIYFFFFLFLLNTAVLCTHNQLHSISTAKKATTSLGIKHGGKPQHETCNVWQPSFFRSQITGRHKHDTHFRREEKKKQKQHKTTQKHKQTQATKRHRDRDTQRLLSALAHPNPTIPKCKIIVTWDTQIGNTLTRIQHHRTDRSIIAGMAYNCWVNFIVL